MNRPRNWDEMDRDTQRAWDAAEREREDAEYDARRAKEEADAATRRAERDLRSARSRADEERNELESTIDSLRDDVIEARLERDELRAFVKRLVDEYRREPGTDTITVGVYLIVAAKEILVKQGVT